MKPTYSRRIRRPKPTADASFAKKETQHDALFFGASPSTVFFQAAPSIQRKCEGCEKEEKKDATAQAMKNDATEKKGEEQKVQKKDSPSPSCAAPHLPQLAGKGAPLSPASQAFFAARMGTDFSNVRIHTGTEADASAKSLRAQAYTVGNNIVFADGKYTSDTADGKKLLAHELTHVLQQRGENTDAVQRSAELDAAPLEEEIARTEITSHSGIGTEVENRTDNAFCSGANFHGSATANYSSSFTSADNITTSTGCRNCRDADCISAEGTITSTFNAAPTTRLPTVPARFNACEREAAQTFINTTLTDHENEHVAAFNTYIGTEDTAYTYHGCRAGLRNHLQREHNTVERQRRQSSNAQSAALDPFRASFPCNCP